MKCAQLEMETYKFFYEKEVNVLMNTCTHPLQGNYNMFLHVSDVYMNDV